MRKLISLFLLSAASSMALSAPSPEVQAKIQQLKERGQREGWTFSVGYNASQEIPASAKTGLKVPANWEKMASWDSLPESNTLGLPARWDWREHGGVTPIKDQGQCGSCWAFGTVAAFESAVLVHNKTSVNIAEQQLVDCDTAYLGCDGGFYGFDFWTVNGAAHGNEYPYTAVDGTCNSSAPHHEVINQWAFVGTSGQEPTTRQIKQAIFKYGAVAATIAADNDSFFSYQSGVYNDCDQTMVDHIVAIVGWDDTKQAWIMRNSWGTSWGENGYMHIRYTGKKGQKCASLGGTAAFVLSLWNP